MNRKTIVIGLAVLAAAAAAGFAQMSQPDRIVVPLTDPTKPASVSVEAMFGSIKVTGYEGKEVIVEATVRERAVKGMPPGVYGEPPVPPEAPEPPEPPGATAGRRKYKMPPGQAAEEFAAIAGRLDELKKGEEAEKAKAAGLKKFPLASSGLTVEENNNLVSVGLESFRRAYDLDIKVPAGSSLKIEAQMGGSVQVDNVGGEVEVQTMNGPVTLQNVSGTVVANTTNGDITAVLSRVAPDKPMSFVSFNGDVDVTLPADARATLKLKSQEGDVYSDFDLALKAAPVRTEESGKSAGRFHVSIERAAQGTINGGGVEMKIETFNGNIYIRKKK